MFTVSSLVLLEGKPYKIITQRKHRVCRRRWMFPIHLFTNMHVFTEREH